MFVAIMKRAGLAAEFWDLLRLAAPLALAQLGLMLMGFVDVAIVGRLGAVPLAAVGVGNGLFFTLSVIGIGAMMGFDPLIAQALGSKEPLRARKLLWQAVWMAAAASVVLIVPQLLLPELLVPFGVAEDIAEETRAYVVVRSLSTFPVLLYAGARSYLQAVKRPWALVSSIVFANIANLILDWVLVFGGAKVPLIGEHLAFIPALGTVGAAWATVGCATLQVIILALAIRKVKVDGYRRSMRAADLPALRHALKVGLPVGLQMGAEVGVFALAGVLAARLGAEAASAHQIALTLASASFCVAVGISNAGSVRVGHAVGAGDLHGVRRSGAMAFVVGGGVMSASALLFIFAPRWVAGALTDKPDILAAAVPLLGVAAAFQISDGLQAVGAGVLRGAGDTRAAFVANLVGHWAVGLPIALVAGLWLGMGVIGLWWGLAAGLTAVAGFLIARFVRLSSRPIVPLAHGQPTPPEVAVAPELDRAVTE